MPLLRYRSATTDTFDEKSAARSTHRGERSGEQVDFFWPLGERERVCVCVWRCALNFFDRFCGEDSFVSAETLLFFQDAFILGTRRT